MALVTPDYKITDMVNESVVILGLDGRIKRWNKSSERIYGWQSREAEGRQYAELLGGRPWPDDEGAVNLGWVDAKPVDLRRRNADGKILVVRTRLSLRRSDSGEPLDYVEVGSDLTAQLQREELAEANRDYYRNVFQAIPISIWDIDISEALALATTWLESTDHSPETWFSENPNQVRELMRVTYARDANEQSVKLFGPCERDDLLGSVARYWPESSIPIFAAWLISALSGEIYFTRETRHRKHDGSEFDALFTASFTAGSVGQGRVVVSIVDNSEVKRGQAAIRKSEAFYADMFHGSAFSAWHLDATEAQKIYRRLYEQGVSDFRQYAELNPGFIDQVSDAIKVVDVNDHSLILFEAHDRQDIVGNSISPFWFRDERRDALLGSLEASFNRIPSYQSAAKMRTLAGNEIDVFFTRSASSALNTGGHLLLAIVDMTEKVKARNALAEMQANFAHADRVSSLGQLTASIAHEVNQPLTAIAANGEASLRWLSRSPPELERVHALLDDMILDARRASEIVAHIRSMALPQTGHREHISLNCIVEEAIVLLGSQLIKCGVRATCHLQPNIPMVVGHSVQLQQVIVNLVLNALQAMSGKQGSRLLLQTTSTQDMATLTIDDNGPGIKAEHLEKIFNSFFTTKSDGMGMGLAICRTLVQAHGGAISAAASTLGGARFTVSLPVVSSKSASQGNRPSFQ